LLLLQNLAVHWHNLVFILTVKLLVAVAAVTIVTILCMKLLFV